MTLAATSSSPTRARSRRLRRTWKVFNSAPFVALITVGLGALLTDWYADRQAHDTDMAARRAELGRVLVELELRTARLQVIQLQAADSKVFTPSARTRLGERAKAIVAGDDKTVTSDPAFKNVHLLSLLGRAETAAGVKLSDKTYLPDFTDRLGTDAVTRASYVLCRSYRLVRYLKGQFEAGGFPLKTGDDRNRQYYSAIYSQLDLSPSCDRYLPASPKTAKS